jgi:hypothetical protein
MAATTAAVAKAPVFRALAMDMARVRTSKGKSAMASKKRPTYAVEEVLRIKERRNSTEQKRSMGTDKTEPLLSHAGKVSGNKAIRP